MERAARITGRGDHRHALTRGGKHGKIHAPREILTRQKPVKQLWLINLAAVFMELDRKKDAETVMARSDLGETGPRPHLRYRGAAPLLNQRRPGESDPGFLENPGRKAAAADGAAECREHRISKTTDRLYRLSGS